MDNTVDNMTERAEITQQLKKLYIQLKDLHTTRCKANLSCEISKRAIADLPDASFIDRNKASLVYEQDLNFSYTIRYEYESVLLSIFEQLEKL